MMMERIRNRSTGAEIITNLLHCSEIILNLSTRISDLRELIENYDNLKKDNQSEDSDEGSAKRLTDDNDEIVKITIAVKVIYILEIQRNILNTVSGSECPFECSSGAEVAGFDTNGGIAAA